jgi:hypothetical protein
MSDMPGDCDFAASTVLVPTCSLAAPPIKARVRPAAISPPARRRGSKLPHLPCDSRSDEFRIETARDRKIDQRQHGG